MARDFPPIGSDIPTGVRPAARVLLFSPAENVLLLRASLATLPDFWVCPGGGLEPGESWGDAAVREVREETGLEVELGPELWFRRHAFEDAGRCYDLFERFFLGRCATENLAPLQQDSYIVGSRWWPVEELIHSQAMFAPRQLPALMEPIARGDLPDVPFDVGV